MQLAIAYNAHRGLSIRMGLALCFTIIAFVVLPHRAAATHDLEGRCMRKSIAAAKLILFLLS
jgi:hypothetical protein